jgi:ABC-type transporter Mla subunit MlaD
MNRWILNSLGIALIASLGLAVWGGMTFGKHLIVMVDTWTAAGNSANSALQTVNQPCGNGKPCGTLAEVSKATVKIGDIAVTSQMQIAQTGKLLSVTTKNIDSVSSHLNKTADALTDTANTATQTVKQANADLQLVSSSIPDLKPLVFQLQKNGASLQTATDALNMRLRDPHVDNLMAHLDEISGTGESMLDTANQVETKATKSYLHPSKNPFVRTWTVAEPWLNIGAQGIVKFGPVLH